MDPSTDLNVEIGAHSIRVARSTILSVPDLKTRVQQRAMDGYTFADDELYFWGATISTMKVDTYYTAMAPSSLRNYEVDADEDEGMAFQNSHKTRELNFGRSVTGKFTGGAEARTNVDFYTVRDLDVNGVNTNQLIRGMQTGILKDVSIGFYGGWYRCSICNEDMFDWSVGWDEMCPHIPGIEYDLKDSKGNVTGREVAIAYVEDAHASETSIVYDGACPGAAIRKAIMEAEGGRIKPEYATMVQTRYRVNLPGFNMRKYGGISLPERNRSMAEELLEPVSDEQNAAELEAQRVAAAGETPAGEETPAGDNENRDNVETPVVVDTPVTPAVPLADANPVGDRAPELIVADVDQPVDPTETIRSAMTKAGIKPGADPVGTLRALAQEVARNRRFAKDGQHYRQSLIDEVCQAGITAQGDRFNEDSYRSLLKDANIDTIITVRDGFQKDAADLIPSGRQTSTPDQTPIVNIETRQSTRPRSVFANG